MGNTKTISGIYKEHLTSFYKHIKEAKNLNEEVVHKLRVDIKQLRSLYRFLEVLSKNKFSRKKVQKIISPLFDAAGEMRTTALNLKLTKALPIKILSPFVLYLKKEEQQKKELFIKELKDFDRKKFEKKQKNIIRYFKKEKGKSINKRSKEYIGSIYNEIRAVIPGATSDESFHEIRKKLKDIKAITKLLESLLHDKTLNIQYKKIKTLEEKIGKWHDSVIFAQELEKFISTNISKYLSLAKKTKNNKQNKKLSLLVVKLKVRSETNKKNIAKQLEKTLLKILPITAAATSA